MFFLFSLVLLMISILLTIGDPFMANKRHWHIALWLSLFAVVSFGVGIGTLF